MTVNTSPISGLGVDIVKLAATHGASWLTMKNLPPARMVPPRAGPVLAATR